MFPTKENSLAFQLGPRLNELVRPRLFLAATLDFRPGLAAKKEVGKTSKLQVFEIDVILVLDHLRCRRHLIHRATGRLQQPISARALARNTQQALLHLWLIHVL